MTLCAWLGGAAAVTVTGAASWLLYPRAFPASSAEQLAAAEARLLNGVRARGVSIEQSLISVGRGQHINTVVVRQASAQRPPSGRVLVLVHGLGGGIGLWARNLAPLARHYDKVYAFDLLGFGRSSRPVAPGTDPADAQRWWVDSVEAWRSAVGLDEPFELCGHSLGSFVAASYALEHPARVTRLVLAAPVGLHDMSERIERLSPRFRRMVNVVLGLGLNRTALIGLLGPYQSSKVRNVLESRGERWYGMDADTREYTFHLQFARPVGDGRQRTDAGDAAFSRFLSMTEVRHIN